MPQTLPWWWTIIAGPLFTALLATAGAWIAVSFDRRKTLNQELIKKRIAIYDEMAPMLNDLLCFFLCVGHFRDLAPATVIARKRDLDRLIHVYLPIFSPALKPCYDAFSKACFLPYAGGSGKPALIKANLGWLEMGWGSHWKAAWNESFVVPEEASDLEEVQRCYDALMDQFARELGASGRGRHGVAG